MTPEEIAEARNEISGFRAGEGLEWKDMTVLVMASRMASIAERALNALEEQMKSQPTEPPQPEFDREAFRKMIDVSRNIDPDASEKHGLFVVIADLGIESAKALAYLDRLESQLSAKDAEIERLNREREESIENSVSRFMQADALRLIAQQDNERLRSENESLRNWRTATSPMRHDD